MPFDLLAPAYDSWFEGEGKLIFAIETAALRQILPSLPKPWLEIGIGTGRFARALGIDTGIDPSREMLRIAREHGVRVFAGKGEQQIFDAGSFDTAANSFLMNLQSRAFVNNLILSITITI